MDKIRLHHRALAPWLLLLLFHGSAHATHGANPALADDPSPYLRLHAQDPVHWRRWEASTIEDARSTGKLLFVSIGYFLWLSAERLARQKESVVLSVFTDKVTLTLLLFPIVNAAAGVTLDAME